MAHTFRPHTVEFLEVAQDILHRAAKNENIANAVKITRIKRMVTELLEGHDVPAPTIDNATLPLPLPLLPTTTPVTDTTVTKTAASNPQKKSDASVHRNLSDYPVVQGMDIITAAEAYIAVHERAHIHGNIPMHLRLDSLRYGTMLVAEHPSLLVEHQAVTRDLIGVSVIRFSHRHYKDHKNELARIIIGYIAQLADHNIKLEVTPDLRSNLRNVAYNATKIGQDFYSDDEVKKIHAVVAQHGAINHAAKKIRPAAATQTKAKIVDVYHPSQHVGNWNEYPFIETMNLDNARRAYRAVGSRLHAPSKDLRKQRLDSMRFGVLLAKQYPQLLREELSITSDIIATGIDRLYQRDYIPLRSELGAIVTGMIDAEPQQPSGRPIGLIECDNGKEAASHIRRFFGNLSAPRHFHVTDDFVPKLRLLAKNEGIDVDDKHPATQLPAAKDQITVRTTLAPVNGHVPTNGLLTNGEHVNDAHTNGAHTNGTSTNGSPAQGTSPTKVAAPPAVASVKAASIYTSHSKPLTPPTVHVGNNGSREFLDQKKKAYDVRTPRDLPGYSAVVADFGEQVRGLRENAGGDAKQKFRETVDLLEHLVELNQSHMAAPNVCRPLISHATEAVARLGGLTKLHLGGYRPRLLTIAGSIIENCPSVIENWREPATRFARFADSRHEDSDEARQVAERYVTLCREIAQKFDRDNAKRPTYEGRTSYPSSANS